MIQLILLVIFFISLFAVFFILYRKLSVLVQLPQNGHHGLKKPKYIMDFEKKIKDHYFHIFEKKVPLHKFLSKARVWILKMENKIEVLLHGIRKNAQELDKKNGKK